MVIVYSDVPPLGNEGISMSVLAHRIIRCLEPNVYRVITRAYSKKYPRDLIGSKLAAPTLLSWDCGGVGLRFLRGRIRSALDRLLLRAWVALSFSRPAPSDNVSELIGLSGPHWQFLPRLNDLARLLNLPYSVYVIDDYEVTAENAGPSGNLERGHAEITRCLREARTVFSICPGMAERLRSSYQVESRVLYPVADDVAPEPVASTSATLNRTLVYIGSLGPTYLPPLLEIARALDERDSPWTLRILSSDTRTYARVFAGFKHVTAKLNSSREDLRAEVAASDAILMPYTAAPEWKITIQTSFPSKFMDAVGAGKPVVVFAPAYASITRHLRDNGLTYDAQTIDELMKLLMDAPWEKTDDWRHLCLSILDNFHSPSAARKVLLASS